MSNDATILKTTINFCKILETLAVGLIYLAMSATTPFRISLYFPRPPILGNDPSHTGLHDTIVQIKPQLSWCGFTTEGIYSTIWLCRGCRLEWLTWGNPLPSS